MGHSEWTQGGNRCCAAVPAGLSASQDHLQESREVRTPWLLDSAGHCLGEDQGESRAGEPAKAAWQGQQDHCFPPPCIITTDLSFCRLCPHLETKCHFSCKISCTSLRSQKLPNRHASDKLHYLLHGPGPQVAAFSTRRTL